MNDTRCVPQGCPYHSEQKVKEQVVNVCNTSIVQKAWKKGAALSVHGWIYNIENGNLKDLDSCISSSGQPEKKEKKKKRSHL